MREVNHRVTGSNSYPCEAWIDSADDAVILLGKKDEWAQFKHIIELTRLRHPQLLDWLLKKPLVALDKADEWERFLSLIDWMCAHPRPCCYLRQVDVPGIHTKFVEAHRGLLSELLDLSLPEQWIDSSASGVAGFVKRYGLHDKPERIRFRVLDSSLNPLNIAAQSDITLDAESLNQLKVFPRNVFITENEINFLAFPQLQDSWIIFGSGYALSSLRSVPRLHECRIYYWGDIDTHGFTVLDQLRAYFADAESFLMDRTTFVSCQHFWVREDSPGRRALLRLKQQEAELYNDLLSNKYDKQLRLEQERIPFSQLLAALEVMGFTVRE